MKVLVLLGLLAVVAFASEDNDLSKKLIGGPDSLRPSRNETKKPGFGETVKTKAVAAKDKIVALAQQLKTKFNSGMVKICQKSATEHLKDIKTNVLEAADKIKAKIIQVGKFDSQDFQEFKDDVVAHAEAFKNKVAEGYAKVKRGIIKAGKFDTPEFYKFKAKVAAGAAKLNAKISAGFAKVGEKINTPEFVEFKGKVAASAEKLKNKVVAGFQKTKEFLKDKICGAYYAPAAPEVEILPVAPAVEQSAFAEETEVPATGLKNKVVKGAKQLKAKVVTKLQALKEKAITGLKKAKKILKKKFAKKEKKSVVPEAAPVVTPVEQVAEQSGFFDDAKNTVKGWYHRLKNKLFKKKSE